ncbi:MAG TPA: OmpA family protein [Kofleriaceae bacterium]|nr:OmpA family protein [Kofleriaceae bacterium]
MRALVLCLVIGCEPAREPPRPSPPPAIATVDAATVDAKPRVIVTESDPCGLVMDQLYFRDGATTLEPAQLAVLAETATMIRCFVDRHEIRRFEVQGHADVRERDPQRLSEQRARAVMQGLIDRGVPPLALTAAGYGAREPLDRTGTAAARAKNRRVAFVVVERGGR